MSDTLATQCMGEASVLGNPETCSFHVAGADVLTENLAQEEAQVPPSTVPAGKTLTRSVMWPTQMKKLDYIGLQILEKKSTHLPKFLLPFIPTIIDAFCLVDGVIITFNTIFSDTAWSLL